MRSRLLAAVETGGVAARKWCADLKPLQVMFPVGTFRELVAQWISRPICGHSSEVSLNWRAFAARRSAGLL
jgi:hypothetical protein